MNYLLKFMVSFVKLINYLIKSFLLIVYLRTLLKKPLKGALRPFHGQCPIMVYLWGYFNYFLLMYGIYISKTYFKKFSYNKDIKMDIL